jgi:hypothetical protein
MINVSEHFYDDDPGQGHPDVRTRLDGAAYFFLGNGLIQAAVQFAPNGEGTALGLLVMDPERLGKKREARSFDPARGLEPTMVRIDSGGRACRPRHADVSVEWTSHGGVPAVRARWSSADLAVSELFFCPDRTTPRLTRAVQVRSTSDRACELRVVTGIRNVKVEQPMTLAARGEACAWFVYTLDAAQGRVSIAAAPGEPLLDEARRYWVGRMDIAFGDSLLDRFFAASRCQLPAVVSAHGRVDAGIWQYNREWVRDQALMALGLVMLGHREEAAVMFGRLLAEFITPEGASLDSSETRDRDEVELDQNGFLLYALQQYVLWTGDLDLVAASWARIEAIAAYPLRSEFRHEPSGLLHNRREF